MTEPQPDQNLASTKDIVAALTALRFAPPSTTTLVRIAKAAREPFLESLSACVTKRDDDGAHQQRLRAMLASASDETIGGLATRGISVSVEDLTPIAARKPNRFLSLLAAALDPANPRNAEACTVFAGFHPNASPNTTPTEQGAAPAPVSVAEPPPPAEPTVRSKDYRSVHVYGAKFAICFNAVLGQDLVPGVMVDAAVVTATPRLYDWRNAIHIMLDAREVGAVLAVFRRWRQSAEFTAHGRMNDKAFVITQQDGGFYCKVSAKVENGQGIRGVKILPLDVTKVALLFTEQLLLAHPGVPPTEVLATVRAAHHEQTRA